MLVYRCRSLSLLLLLLCVVADRQVSVVPKLGVRLFTLCSPCKGSGFKLVTAGCDHCSDECAMVHLWCSIGVVIVLAMLIVR
jgi:hypothetical protein